MPNADPHRNIARKVQFVEHAKIALVEHIAGVFRAVQSGSERELAEAIGQVVAISYALGHQLDVPLSAIDRAAAEQGLPASIAQDLVDPNLLQSIATHLKAKR